MNEASSEPRNTIENLKVGDESISLHWSDGH